MDFSVGQILVEINKNTMWQTLLSGFIGAIVGAGISGLFMICVDAQNRFRWEKSNYQQRKNELTFNAALQIDEILGFMEDCKYQDFANEENISKMFYYKQEELVSLYKIIYALNCFYENNILLKSLLSELKRLIHFQSDLEYLFSKPNNKKYKEMITENIIDIIDEDKYVNCYKYINFVSKNNVFIYNRLLRGVYSNPNDFKEHITKLIGMLDKESHILKQDVLKEQGSIYKSIYNFFKNIIIFKK